MAKKGRYSVEAQKGPIDMTMQYSQKFRQEPRHTAQDMENLRLRQEKMTMDLHMPNR